MRDVFRLTKREQRIVIILALLLVGGMIIKRSREPVLSPAPVSVPAATPPPSPSEDVEPDEPD